MEKLDLWWMDFRSRYEREEWHRLGYMVGALLLTFLVWLGTFIQNDSQLIVVFTITLILILAMGLVSWIKSKNRFTRRERLVGKCSVFHPPTVGEQKCLQLAAILALAMVILGIIQKGPMAVETVTRFLWLLVHGIE